MLRARNVYISIIRLIDVYAAQHDITRGEAINRLIKIALEKTK